MLRGPIEDRILVYRLGAMNLTPAGWFFLGLVIVVPAGILIEKWRQERKYGKTSGRGNLLGAAAMDLQRHLEPERKVETLLERNEREETDESGEPAKPER